MAANDYVFLTRWRVEGKAEEAFDILNDVPGYLRWWPEVYLGVANLALGDRDGVGKTYALLTRGKNQPTVYAGMPGSSTNSGQAASRLKLPVTSWVAVCGRSSNIRSTWISSSIGASEPRSRC